jgi:23S rRNA pseudouridine1911/1915/1917 synthase
MAVTPSGRPAVTRYRVIDRFEGYGLLEVRLETGRTHQIRVHLAERGHPIVGDSQYGSPKKTDPPIGRQALHAYRLRFSHPITGERLSFEAPLPEDMQGALDFLRKRRAAGA